MARENGVKAHKKTYKKAALRQLQTVKKPLGCVEGPLPFD